LTYNILIVCATIFIRFVTRLCLNFEAKGGGYLKAKDLRTNTVLSAVSYTKTVSNRQLCYRFDDAPPEHCSVTGTCSSDPLHLDHIISRDPIHTVVFTGWSDPVPTGGMSVTASQIENYEIRVNEVLPSKGINKVDYTINFQSIIVNHTITEMTLNLTSHKPHLYCLTLEVKDVADNVRQCRRFILVDSTSYIETRPEKPFHVMSASPDTGFTWQTHHNDICLSWKDYFLNRFYFDNELFNGVETDPHRLITGTYEHTSAELQVSGTPNVYGIVKYMVSWKLNNEPFTSEIEVPDFLNQTYCQRLPVQDGETYTFNIRPVDIVGNTYNESRTLLIDKSPPFVNTLCIKNERADGNCARLIKYSEPILVDVESYDNHSGIRTIKWEFGMLRESNDSLDIEIAVGNLTMVTFYIFIFYTFD